MIEYKYRTNISLVNAAHQFSQAKIEHGDVAIDATVGNGHDTVFLAKQVGVDGKVYGFDIQQCALNNTKAYLQKEGFSERVSLHLASHVYMVDIVKEPRVKAIMFNLGYLPGADKTIITKIDSTLLALESALTLISDAGGISIIAYPGHEGGDGETAAITRWYQDLDVQQFIVEVTLLKTQTKQLPPQLILISKSL